MRQRTGLSRCGVRCGLLFAVCFCACTDVGLGVPGTGTPLPPGGLPPGQTLEGGAQIQITATGLQKFTNALPAILGSGVGQDVCVAEMSLLGASACDGAQGGCSPGCLFDVEPQPVFLQPSVPDAQTLRLAVTTSATASVRIRDPFLPPCTMSLTVGSMSVNADIGFSIDPATGAFGAGIDTINTVAFGNVSGISCATVTGIENLVDLVLESLAQGWVANVVATLNAGIDGFVPAQQELAASIDLSALALAGLAASNGSAVETRIVPGGYAQFSGGGLSLGVVTGFNSDADPLTRSADLVSEPDACVAGLTAPDLALPPHSLPTTLRGTFALPAAGAFAAIPMPTGDLLVGISRTALDLAGHHMVASGGLCLALDAGQAGFLRRDALDDLLGVPLAAADAELRLVVRPHAGIRFEIGEGSDVSPHLNAVLGGLQIDVETVAAGIGTPALSLTADVGVGMQLHTRHDAGFPVRLETTRSSLAIENPVVTVLDARYAGVNAAALDALVATAVDVVFSTLGADAGSVLVSGIAGFGAENVSVTPVSTASDEFLAVAATIGPTLPVIDPPAPTPQPTSVTLELPTPAALRAALLAGDDVGLPALHVALPIADGVRPLEHAWRIAGSAWRPYEATGELVIRDRSFAWQGERTIELRSRVVGDDGTTSPIGSTTLAIDYAAPTIFAGDVVVASHLTVPARDAVSDALEWAMGRVNETVPATAWTSDPNLDLAAARALGDEIVVYVRDGDGNLAQATVAIPEPAAAAAIVVSCATLALLARRSARFS